jgi:hypothetical protein
MLNSPVYAGIYAYGRRRVDASRQQPGRPATGRRCKDPGEWIAMIEDALPGYISKQQYQQNLDRLAANQPRADTPGAIRYGPTLLAGLLRCGRCRRRMTVGYHVDAGKPRTSYNCGGARAEWGGPVCQRMSGHCIDQTVTDAVLHALTPAAVAVSLQATEQIHTERARLQQLWNYDWNALRSPSTGPAAATRTSSRKPARRPPTGGRLGTGPARTAETDRRT